MPGDRRADANYPQRSPARVLQRKVSLLADRPDKCPPEMLLHYCRARNSICGVNQLHPAIDKYRFVITWQATEQAVLSAIAQASLTASSINVMRVSSPVKQPRRLLLALGREGGYSALEAEKFMAENIAINNKTTSPQCVTFATGRLRRQLRDTYNHCSAASSSV